MVKYLECPNCGFVFKAPIMDIKFTHLGWTIPGTGLVKCPNCKEEKRRKFYKKATESDLTRNSTAQDSADPVKATSKSETDMIEDSKYEDK